MAFSGVSGVSDEVVATAYLTAVARAEATQDPDTPFDDPFAARFAQSCPKTILDITRRTAGRPVVAARSMIVDRMLSRALDRADGRTGDQAEVCVNLGAGFDARPYRMAWPAGIRVVEIDAPAVLDLKDRLLPAAEARVPVERIACDIRDVPALSRALAPVSSASRIVILAEGLLPYFEESYVAELAGLLAALSKSAVWVADVLSVDSARVLTDASRKAGTILPMHGLEDMSAFEAAGWRCEDLEVLPTARLTSTTALMPDGVLELRSGG